MAPSVFLRALKIYAIAGVFSWNDGGGFVLLPKFRRGKDCVAMERLKQLRSVLFVLGAVACVPGALALGPRGAPGSDAAGCFACSTCGGFLIAGLVIHIVILVWVARDAKARGMDSAVLWMLLVLFLPLIGLIIYIFARPQGAMRKCPNCGNNRLQASLKCPHCGAA
jgi:drug/metabolite transporter (DMT)-like permease